MDALIFVVGLALLSLVLWDIFQAIVVPRPTPGRFRIARIVVRPSWFAWRAFATRVRTGLGRDALLGLFAPGAIIILLVVWLLSLAIAYGVILFALRAEIQPSPTNLLEAIYFAGVSLLTIGYGDVLASGALSRIVVLVSAASGLGIVALVITFIFSLFSSYQRREVLVVTLAARAKSPPSAVTLLETYARLGMTDDLPALFREWEVWEAEVLDTHVAYPLLGYFRSSHDNISWLSALGAVLDGAALVLTTIRGVHRGQAEITKRVGAHLVEDISNNLHLHGDGSAVAYEEFSAVYDRLAVAGYDLEPREEAWRAFEHARGSYAGRLQALADYWATPAAAWVGHYTRPVSAVHETQPAGAAGPVTSPAPVRPEVAQTSSGDGA